MTTPGTHCLALFTAVLFAAVAALGCGQAFAGAERFLDAEPVQVSALEIGDALYIPPPYLAALDAPAVRSVLAARESRTAGPLAPSPFLAHILAAARETDIEPALIHAVITAESGHNPSARSPHGALGLMQLMPGTAKRYGVTNRLDPAQNIHGGARYLRDLMTMFDNDLHLVLAAYNAGEDAVMRYGRRIPPFRATMAFVPKVMGYYWRFHRERPEAR